MRRPCSFMVVIDGQFSKFYDSYCIDRQEAIAQMREIYTADSEIEVYLFRHKD